MGPSGWMNPFPTANCTDKYVVARSPQSKLEARGTRRRERRSGDDRAVVQRDGVDVRLARAETAGAEIEDPLLIARIPTEDRVVVGRVYGFVFRRKRAVVDSSQLETSDDTRSAD